MPVYATSEDLSEWTGAAAPAAVERLLRQASRLVRRATLTAVYETNPATDLPVEPDVLDAFRDATCAQVEAWVALDIDPSAGPAGAAAAPIPQSSSILGATVNYAVSLTLGDARAAAARDLSGEAYDILTEAGLVHGRVTVY